ncbi:MAG: hypothetical protein PVF73_00225 [Bacteroidales bacterium]|jgi:hypothetical protein
MKTRQSEFIKTKDRCDHKIEISKSGNTIMTKTGFFLFFFLTAVEVFCQDSIDNCIAKHYISLKSGGRRYYTRDKVYSPMIYKGTGVPMDIEYHNHKTKRDYRVYLHYTQTKVTSSITGDKDGFYANYFDLLNINIGFQYLRHIRSCSGWDIQLGGAWENFVLYKNQVLIYENSQWALDVFSDLKLACHVRRAINEKSRIQADISYPLLSYVMGRVYAPQHFPEKLLKYDEDELTVGAILKSGDFLTLNKFVNFQFSTGYFISLSKHFGLSMDYVFQYYQYPKSEVVKNAMHSLLIGLTLKW